MITPCREPMTPNPCRKMGCLPLGGDPFGQKLVQLLVLRLCKAQMQRAARSTEMGKSIFD